MSVSKLVRRAALVLMIGAIGLAATQAIGQSPPRGSSPNSAPPSSTPGQRLEAPRAYPKIGIRFDPPADNQQASISADDAVALAWKEAVGPAGRAEPVLAKLGLDAVSGGRRGAAVWVVSFPDMCIQPHGPYGPHQWPAGECPQRGWVVVLDAQTGAYLTSFSSAS